MLWTGCSFERQHTSVTMTSCATLLQYYFVFFCIFAGLVCQFQYLSANYKNNNNNNCEWWVGQHVYNSSITVELLLNTLCSTFPNMHARCALHGTRMRMRSSICTVEQSCMAQLSACVLVHLSQFTDTGEYILGTRSLQTV